MAKWKDLVTTVGAVLMFVGLHSKLQQMGVVDEYWWVVFGAGFIMFTYLADKLDGKISGLRL